MREFVANDPLVAYADVGAALLGSDGQPRADFYTANGLNLSEPGYQAWTQAVRPLLDMQWPKKP